MSTAALTALFARDLSLHRSYRLALGYDAFWGVMEVVLYYFISRVVGGIPAGDLGTAPSYFAFALAGILMSLIVGSATAEIASRVREEELAGTLEALVAQPVRASELAAGWAAFPLLWAFARLALYLALAVAFLDLGASDVSWLGVLLMVVAAALAFFPLGVLAAAATVVFKRGGAIVGVAIFAMTLLGGALFPISVLPGWLEAIGKVMPTRFAFDGMRAALFGGGWGLDALVLTAIGVVAVPLSLWLFARALERAKRDGSLAQY
jgi:ABC-type polysaccharide/polyol phosphate export permease